MERVQRESKKAGGRVRRSPSVFVLDGDEWKGMGTKQEGNSGGSRSALPNQSLS